MRLFSAALVFLPVLLLAGRFAGAQKNKPATANPPAQPPALVSPEVYGDGSVTFRFRAPNALEVKLALEGAEPVAMQKDGQGVWSVTTAPLAPDIYGYAIVADGVRLIDPSNNWLKPNLIDTENVVHVPGPASLPWELNDVPHGVIHHHFYKSKAAEDQRDYYVYTPPGYQISGDRGSGNRSSGAREYPVLYLLHGFSDDASGWTAVGQANVILDNLIAQGKTKPMIVVMPRGYGTMEIVRKGWNSWRDTELRDRNFAKFSDGLLTEVMPRVQSEYRVSRNRNARAIAGLSMGGSESLLTGLNNLDKFSWIGAFSSGGLPEDFNKDFPSLDAGANRQIRLLWIACGTGDHLIGINRNFREWLTGKGVKHADIETPGMHTWMVWRRNLTEFAELLFR